MAQLRAGDSPAFALLETKAWVKPAASRTELHPHRRDCRALGSLMAQRNNWSLFAPFFTKEDELMVSLLRLAPIRNAVAHGRPLSQTDTLYVAAEGMRLFKAVGILTSN